MFRSGPTNCQAWIIDIVVVDVVVVVGPRIALSAAAANPALVVVVVVEATNLREFHTTNLAPVAVLWFKIFVVPFCK